MKTGFTPRWEGFVGKVFGVAPEKVFDHSARINAARQLPWDGGEPTNDREPAPLPAWERVQRPTSADAKTLKDQRTALSTYFSEMYSRCRCCRGVPFH